MLDNWPPPDTPIETTHVITRGDVTIPSGTQGTIKETRTPRGPERADDQFHVKLHPPGMPHSFDVTLTRIDIRLR
jgi:hypothetical protein